MNNKNYTELPYSFDLLFDIKTLEHLHDHLTGKQRQATSGTDDAIMTLMVDENIPFPDGVIPPFVRDVPHKKMAQHYAELLNFVQKLHDNPVADAQWLIQESGKVLANQPNISAERKANLESSTVVKKKTL